MKTKLSPLALICSALLFSGCSWDGGNDPTPPPPQENQAPVAGDKEGLNVEQGQSLEIDLALYASDPDGDTLQYTITVMPTKGTLVPKDGTTSVFVYTPNDGVLDADNFTYQVADEEFSDEGVISLTVIPEGSGEDLIDTVDKLNAAIQSATAGDVIELAASGTFNSGVIELNKAVTIDGLEQAVISGSACFRVAAAGAVIQNLTMKNDMIGFDETDDKLIEATKNDKVLTDEEKSAIYAPLYDKVCSKAESLGKPVNSDGQMGAITILATLDDDAADYDSQLAALEPVELINITFDASANTEQSNYGNTKASWVTSFSKFAMSGSEFIGLQSTIQNNGIYVNCTSSDEGRAGSSITTTSFSMVSGGDKETAAIKMGDSSGGKIKGDATGGNATCNVTVEGNTFNDYLGLQTQDMSVASNRPVAIHSWTSAITNTDFASNNTLITPTN
ncbi:Ig-like domain-containing protein [Ferrimonas senticii]|uniref:Ig-like domain-containing protein n=1 Tax=Ferrimonas senticii TaxID=394566 RepID=UPI00042A522F|nr:Ig-like domain-containing protein [Ferrimonas senticii]